MSLAVIGRRFCRQPRAAQTASSKTLASMRRLSQGNFCGIGSVFGTVSASGSGVFRGVVRSKGQQLSNKSAGQLAWKRWKRWGAAGCRNRHVGVRWAASRCSPWKSLRSEKRGHARFGGCSVRWSQFGGSQSGRGSMATEGSTIKGDGQRATSLSADWLAIDTESSRGHWSQRAARQIFNALTLTPADERRRMGTDISGCQYRAASPTAGAAAIQSLHDAIFYRRHPWIGEAWTRISSRWVEKW